MILELLTQVSMFPSDISSTHSPQPLDSLSKPAVQEAGSSSYTTSQEEGKRKFIADILVSVSIKDTESGCCVCACVCSCVRVCALVW